MKATKIYGNAIYVNNEKVILAKQALKVLNYDSSVFDGAISSKVTTALEFAANSKSDIDVINAAEKSEIVEINKMVKGFHFKGFAVLTEGVCFGIYLERDGRSMMSEGDNANNVYNQIISNN